MSYQLESRHLRYFLAVAEELHFRKAAEKLYISQPGLSRQIKEMEQGIGIQLFERSNRKVNLTPAGRYLQKGLQGHFKGLNHLIQQAQLLDQGILGNLKFGYVGSAMQRIIPELLLAFQKEYPQVRFHLKEMENQQQIDALMAQELDIGFIRLERVPKGLESFAVLKEPFCLVLPSDHPMDSKNITDLSLLKEESFILFDPKYSTSYYEKVMQIFDDSGFSPIVSHNTIHSNSIYKLVAYHFGISIVPRSLRMDHMEGVKFIELDQLPQRTVLSAIWHTNNPNPVLNGFLDEIRKIKTEKLNSPD
jgi:DNA-binding transcriptional LysR family regulator